MGGELRDETFTSIFPLCRQHCLHKISHSTHLTIVYEFSVNFVGFERSRQPREIESEKENVRVLILFRFCTASGASALVRPLSLSLICSGFRITA